MNRAQAFCLTVIAAAVFTSSIVKADILFLDLNNSPKEIEAAKKAAKQRNEKLIVLPIISAENRRALKAASDNYDKLYKQAQLSCGAGKSDCEQAKAKYSHAYQANADLIKKNSLDADKLSASLLDLKNKKINLTSLVVSGHDGNGHFAGTQGALDDVSISKAFAQAKPLGDNVRSLMLWGCYTANLGSLTQNWKKSFPQVELVAGYDGVAPAGDKPSNWDYLRDSLVKEKKLTAIKDEKELQKSLENLDGVNQLSAAMCVGTKYANRKMALDLKEMQSLCTNIIEDTQGLYNCYLYSTSPKCANPPADTSNSELRDVYNRLQEGRHCEEISGKDARPDAPSPDTFTRLLFFQNVKDNFSANHAIEIKTFNDLLQKVAAPKELLWDDISKMNRADVLKKLNSLKDYLAGRSEKPDPMNPEITALLTGLDGFQESLGDLRVPFSWVEPKSAERNVAMDSVLDGMKASAIRDNRVAYETDRASTAVRSLAENLIANDSEVGAAIRKIDDQVTALNIAERNKDPMAPVVDNSKKIDQLNKQRAELTGKAWPRMAQSLKDYENKMTAEPYASEEGKKVFLEALKESISKISSGR